MIVQAIRGMNDILPDEINIWQEAEQLLRDIFQSHCYHEIRFPIVEKTALFKRSIGEVTDIVEKEMYTFIDRNGESLSLRPEGTACCARAVIEHGLLHNQIQRLWYLGPNFRHERPQKGRSRQFHQCSAEVFGLAGPDIDAELILLSKFILERLGILPHVHLEINTLGSIEARQLYRNYLVQYLYANKDQLDEDSQRRLLSNPLRILDSKDPNTKQLITNAPKLLDYLDEDSLSHWQAFQHYLKALNIPYTVNPNLVRGLDYYNKTVFEWITYDLGAQGTVCAGGRYDALVEQLGGKKTPAIGFSLGMERAILLMQARKNQSPQDEVDLYLISEDDLSFLSALQLNNLLRQQFPHLRILMHCGGGSFKSQFKKADKCKARFALIIGQQEYLSNTISIKSMQEEREQQQMTTEELITFLQKLN